MSPSPPRSGSPPRALRLVHLAPLLAALAACSPAEDSAPGANEPSGAPSEGPGPANGDEQGDAAPETPSTPDADTGADGGEAGPVRPPPQTNVRACPDPKTTPIKLATVVRWVPFSKSTLGAGVITVSPVLLDKPWASGTAGRLATATSGSFANGPDRDASGVRTTFGILSYQQGDTTLSNFAGVSTEPVTSWYYAPSKTVLTYFRGFGVREVAWTMNDPKRTAAATNEANRRFVSGISAGAFFGYEVALSFPSECAVGALSDVLARPAVLKDALADSGIFTPAKRVDIQNLLVRNGAAMHVRVMGSKRQAAIETALATTTCSSADIGACASLLATLDAVSPGGLTSVPSDLVKLQADTDPRWSLMKLHTAPVSALP